MVTSILDPSEKISNIYERTLNNTLLFYKIIDYKYDIAFKIIYLIRYAKIRVDQQRNWGIQAHNHPYP